MIRGDLSNRLFTSLAALRLKKPQPILFRLFGPANYVDRTAAFVVVSIGQPAAKQGSRQTTTG